MEPVFGFALFFVLCVIVAVVASKRGRSWWAYLLGCIVAGPVTVMLVSGAGGSGVGAAFAAFLVPVAALVLLLSSSTGEAMAVKSGEFGDFKKCPFCAESVRKEALKCKHCGSDLSGAQS